MSTKLLTLLTKRDFKEISIKDLHTLDNKPGVYLICCQKNGGYSVLAIDQSNGIKIAIENHNTFKSIQEICPDPGKPIIIYKYMLKSTNDERIELCKNLEAHREYKLTYKGFVIEAAPEQIVETDRWITRVHIYKHTNRGVSEKPFSDSNTFETKEEAVQHCFIYGKQIIEGQIEGCSVDDL